MRDFHFEVTKNHWVFGIGIYKDSHAFAIHFLCFAFGYLM